MHIAHRGLPRTSLLLASLLCAGLAGQAQAVNVIYTGPPGSSGLTGTPPGGAGGNGQAAPDVLRLLLSSDASNTLQLTGGAGGAGGDGAAGNSSVNGGAAGNGGAGAKSTGSLTVTTTGPAALTVYSNGGAGGSPGLPGAAGSGTQAGADGTGGAGGNATAFGALFSNGSLTGTVAATGGQGGSGDNFATGGLGGNASSTLTGLTLSGPAISLSSTATGGDGGATLFGTSGHGGDAASTIFLPNLGIAQTIDVISVATGGNGGFAAFPPEGPSGQISGGGNADSKVTLTSLTPASGGWSAVINGSSTANAGAPSGGWDGNSASASLSIHAYGTVNGTATANGSYGFGMGSSATANANVSSNYMATAKAVANGGSSVFNPGNGGNATATAHGGYAANADAVSTSGNGHAGSTEASYATAQASVLRNPAAPSSSTPSEARAHAAAGSLGGAAQATASYTDAARQASVVVTTAQTDQGHAPPNVLSRANVGGAAYQPWAGWEPDGDQILVSNSASALPTAASVSTLLSGSPNVQAAFPGNQVLGAGTMGTMFFPSQANNAEFHVPFAAGGHLLLGLLSPFPTDGFDSTFDFSVSSNGVTLYSASFTSQAQAVSFFSDHVLDLGVVNSSALDLLIGMHLTSGMFGYAYVFGESAGAAAVPEPQTWLLLLTGMSVLLWRARGRRVS